MFKRITIIGLGLIGGSLGLAIKEKGLAREVIGASRKRSTLRKAVAIGAVDIATRDLKKAVKTSDLVILAVPVLKIAEIADRISKLLKKGAILTDAGSTKNYIARSVERILPEGVSFIGSHPLAGSEKSGIIYADKDLFKGSYCILTRTSHTENNALAKIIGFWNSLGMKVRVMSPESHDKLVSRLSHLPHLVSAGLSNACGKKDLYLAAGGFRDVTRIASGDPELWKDIFIMNRRNILRDIGILRKELVKIEEALAANNASEILKLLKKAKSIRDSA